MKLKPGEMQLNIAIAGDVYRLFKQFCVHQNISYRAGVLQALKLWIKHQQELHVAEQIKLREHHSKAIENAKSISNRINFDHSSNTNQESRKEMQTV